MVNQIYPPELQLNKANASDTDAPVLGLHLFISNGVVSYIFFYNRDDFDFNIVNFLFLDVIFPIAPLMVYTFHSSLGLLGCAVM